MKQTWKIGIVVTWFSLSLMGCQSPQAQSKQTSALTEQQVMADAWYQTAGEVKALYHQGYNIGKMKLDTALAKGSEKKPAIVLDLDETVVDNSPYQAMTVKEKKGFPYKWEEWIQQAKAEALPGAVSFLQYANEKGVSIYYISNRKQNQLDATLQNLQKLNIPQADKNHVLLQGKEEKGKEERRKQIATEHDIVLFFGDNLSDFTGFDEKSVQDRNQTVEEMHTSFGDTYIIFPNPMYGDWESALYQYDFKKSDAEKDKSRKDALRVFEDKK
ncbi:5'-nucleotidase, lipoprotein e(P4) family [Bacillus thuringiensis serovar kyushuensis]|uniref:5'-nucleotidase, lipoprotein e(P4) family n=1 Tax=Bacillus TaxID=1386 RepID=UPI000B44C925|nr:MULTISPECIES: 5'-nucleotidase, lipoprotein e(P4) family [Bacillus cereus group]MEC2865881.1 5'-nucleotidase, lipoprotein e(P4) family [Bacillus cereus]AZR80592.1 5'-nucleotidase, lipoprotein e(P4) family [Bacillus thuringiensis]MBG9522125.1 5'-nucleotidase [Bacillus thuringiensis]OTZ68030.1 5'-nucleotidase, lipoprotein e(P4) family [Bacillus thuringiensis serovar kyushuensis]OTZ68106.1 5'-nucleotidase, lipoprotein e(P4) family [Bacillus thuringiensis serovar tohokuensis]